jgi:hypothetical protein
MALLVKPAPDASPPHPVKTYWMPEPPETVPVERDAYAVELALYQPLPLGESRGELTVR